MQPRAVTRPPTKAELCAGWKPIFVSSADVLTKASADAIQYHDEHGVVVGCWTQPKK